MRAIRGFLGGIRLPLPFRDGFYIVKVSVVHFELSLGMGNVMNTVITSRKALLDAAKDVVQNQGFDHLNIRRLAASCNVSVGCIYTYFSTKADLVAAIVEDFWKGAFHGIDWPQPGAVAFEDFFAVLYLRFKAYLEIFSSDWLGKLGQLDGNEYRKCIETQALYFSHITKGLLHVLEQDDSIPQEKWTKTFTPEQFSQFVFDNMISMLCRKEQDCGFFTEVLRSLLHGERKTGENT